MALAVGTDVGGYEILARLKAGGMATLFLARRTGASGFKRHVAIKIVHDHLAEDRDFVRMFVDEALLQARIQHPNVVHVEELGEAGGQHFLVMEYVHGCSLSQLLFALAKRDRALSPDLAVSIAMQTLAGLHAAHELHDEAGASLGVVHRDVSPQNVLLAYEGHVKLIDFGVAKARNRAQETAAGGILKGKLRYMSPEQASGQAVDRRTDVYALGVVLWEMLTMCKLFWAPDELLLLDLVRNPVIELPSQMRPGVPPAIEAVVMKALSLRPENRYATAQEFRRALAEAAPGALLADASLLSELLGAVMTKELEKEQKQLPASVSGVLANAARRTGNEGEALRTMTISAAGVAYLADAAPSRPSASGMRPVQGSAPSMGASVGASAQPSPHELSTHPIRPPARGANIALAAVGIALALALIAGAGYAAMTLGAAPAEMSATSLAPTAPTASSAPPVPTPVAPAPSVPAVSAPVAEVPPGASIVEPAPSPVAALAPVAPVSPPPAVVPAPLAPREPPGASASEPSAGPRPAEPRIPRRPHAPRAEDDEHAPLATEF